MDTTCQTWLWEKWGKACTTALKKNGFDAHFVHNVEEARRVILDMASQYETFGLGGSDTIRAIGVVEELVSVGKTLYDHWQKGLTKEEVLNIRLHQGRCDCFLCSANAVSLSGEIINVDGVGNRVSAMTFGPKKVIVVAGMNKVRPDLESALVRVKEIASPINASRLGMDTPCAETGLCNDCHSPERICRITTILHRKPMLTDISVILVNQALGF